ncbi:MAG TPA: MlaD family protein [Dongiaceae bacterium]|jgi:phospholipid/cholesterol/gamma-HCH transport system substrate-binding protein|nr:MlaD family protein [Dongiaceae bacterium]
MMRVRYTDEWVGALVIAAIAVLAVAILQAGVLRDWFKSTSELRLILPESGLAGLDVGSDIEILGTKAGVVRRIVLDPDHQPYAILEIDQQATAFIRRDSTAVIRRQFGVAGAAYVDISRGSGAPMDWTYAVIEATTERGPTDSISALIDEVRQKVFPILDNTGRVTQGLAEIVDRTNHGEGSVGRLLVDETLIHQTETAVGTAQDAMKSLTVLFGQLQQSAQNLQDVTRKAGGPDGVPAVLKRTQETLATLQQVLGKVGQSSTRMPAIAKNVEDSTANLPALLTQLQVTTAELNKLVGQLRGSWLLGGGAPEQQPSQFSPSQVVP